MNFHLGCAISRFEWRVGDGSDPLAGMRDFLRRHGFAVDDLAAVPSGPGQTRPDRYAVVLVGAAAAAVAAGSDPGPSSPVPAVPDALAAVFRRRPSPPPPAGPVAVGDWRTTWTDPQHAAAVSAVRAAIGRGDVYQVNVVGHRTAAYSGDIRGVLAGVTRLPGAVHAGSLLGEGWAVATATPECLLTVRDGVARTHPIKGTRPATAAGYRDLLGDPKERAEHVMIVDLVRNDLGRVAVVGGVRVDTLFRPRDWCRLWQAESAVSARLRPGVSLADLLRALLPAGSVTGAPKRSALAHIGRLEPVGRGPSMGAFGVLADGRVDLGLTIRTLAADTTALHLWAGGGITWDSDPRAEVAEAHAKAAPLLAAVDRATAGSTRPGG